MIFLICLLVFDFCSRSENESESWVGKKNCVFDDVGWILEEEWGCGMRGKEIVSLGVFWGNVSERYLEVSRIYLDHHRV